MATIEQLKSQRKTKKNSFNSYAGRRNAIKTIVSNIDNKLDDDVTAINKKIFSCMTELTQGLKGGKNTTTICSDMESIKEKGAGSDSKISSCRGNLSKEISRCQGRINALDSEITQLENQIKAQGGTIYFWE